MIVKFSKFRGKVMNPTHRSPIFSSLSGTLMSNEPVVNLTTFGISSPVTILPFGKSTNKLTFWLSVGRRRILVSAVVSEGAPGMVGAPGAPIIPIGPGIPKPISPISPPSIPMAPIPPIGPPIANPPPMVIGTSRSKTPSSTTRIIRY